MPTDEQINAALDAVKPAVLRGDYQAVINGLPGWWEMCDCGNCMSPECVVIRIAIVQDMNARSVDGPGPVSLEQQETQQ